MRYTDKTERSEEAYSTLILYNSFVLKIYDQNFDIQISGKASYITSNSTITNYWQVLVMKTVYLQTLCQKDEN